MGHKSSLARAVASLLRFIAVALITIAMSLSLLLVTQQIFNPFQVVVSDSMSPQIKTGDAVVISDLKPGDIEVGEVIVFQDPEEKGQFVIHRVVSIEDAGTVLFFTTKGDNNPVPDAERVPTGEVMGGVAARVPNFGSFLDFLATPKGYISCIGLPAAMSLILVIVVFLFEKVFHFPHHGRRLFQPQTTRLQ
ncbi:MAG: signal peptidase I [Actinobacteria bacterium]|nr:signal peptidase I [Actinomycetota bacterium]